MGVGKCSFGCGHAPREMNMKSPSSLDKRFAIPENPLTMHEVFEYHGIDGESVDSKDFEDLESREMDTEHHKSCDAMNGQVDCLLSGFLRSVFEELNVHTPQQQSYNFRLISMLRSVCCRYYHGNFSSRSPDLLISVHDPLGKRMFDVMDLLRDHWGTHPQDGLCFVHLEPLFSGTTEEMSLCRDKWDIGGHILVLIESVGGHVFGGYSTKRTGYDEGAFLFSLTSRKIFPPNKEKAGNSNVFHDDANPQTLIHFGEGPDLMIQHGEELSNQCVPSSFDFHEDFVGEQDTDGHFVVLSITVFQVYGK